MEASVTKPGDKLEWDIRISNEEAAKEFFPLPAQSDIDLNVKGQATTFS